MKFYKVTTKHTQFEINEIILNMTTAEVEYIKELYDSLSIVEYTDSDGFECMYAILNDVYLSRILDTYESYSLKYKISDITKDVINDDIEINYKNEFGKSVRVEIVNLIKKFKKKYVSKDDILDKILEKGMNSLSKEDLKILKS